MLLLLLAALRFPPVAAPRDIRLGGDNRGAGPFQIGMTSAQVRSAARAVGQLRTELELGEGGDQWTVYVLTGTGGERLLVFTFDDADVDEKTGGTREAKPTARLQAIKVVSPSFATRDGISVGLPVRAVAKVAGKGAFHSYEDSTAAVEFDRYPNARFETTPSLWQIYSFEQLEELRKKHGDTVPFEPRNETAKILSISIV